MTMMPVSCTGLKKRFSLSAGGRHQALDGVSIEVREGEIFGLLGPNGAGKTTLIKILLGFIQPDAGEFALFGQGGGPGSRGSVGYVPDGPFFHPFARAREVLSWHGLFAGMLKSDVPSEVARVARQAGIEGILDRRLEGFSKGMLQRLGIAQALLGDPALIIMDEPTGGLDPEAVEAFRRLLAGLKAEGRTILLSTHLLSMAEDLCDRVAVLHRGRVALHGAISELLPSNGDHVFSVSGADPSKLEDLKGLLTAEGLTVHGFSAERPSLEKRFLEFLKDASKGETS